MIVVLDYGMGNLGSISNMFDRLGVAHHVTADGAELAAADGIVLPGVGAFDRGMGQLHDRGLTAPLDAAVTERRVPLLGICLGMHLLARGSEEGSQRGLHYVAADVVRLDPSVVPNRRIPHMGWNRVRVERDGLLPTDSTQRYYFVHSYVMRCDELEDVVGVTSYGGDFVSAVRHENVAGVQFHPEKSHRYGLEVLRRFAAWTDGS